MPIYAYRCSACQTRYEAQQSMTEDAYTECPNCKTETLHRVMQPTPAHYHARGFYSTDYPKDRMGRS